MGTLVLSCWVASLVCSLTVPRMFHPWLTKKPFCDGLSGALLGRMAHWRIIG